MHVFELKLLKLFTHNIGYVDDAWYEYEQKRETMSQYWNRNCDDKAVNMKEEKNRLAIKKTCIA